MVVTVVFDESARSSARCARCMRRRLRKRIGPIPRCSSQAAQSVRSATPMAAQISVRYIARSGFAAKKSSNRATIAAWRRPTFGASTPATSARHRTMAWINCSSSARLTSRSSKSSDALQASCPTAWCSFRKIARLRARGVSHAAAYHGCAKILRERYTLVATSASSFCRPYRTRVSGDGYFHSRTPANQQGRPQRVRENNL